MNGEASRLGPNYFGLAREIHLAQEIPSARLPAPGRQAERKDLFAEIRAAAEQLLRSGGGSPRQLIALQSKVGLMGVQVEALSRIAEGGAALLRRLQNGV